MEVNNTKTYVLPVEVLIALMEKLEDHELALIEEGQDGGPAPVETASAAVTRQRHAQLRAKGQ